MSFINKVVCFDTEYRNSKEKNLHVVCAALYFPHEESDIKYEHFWLNDGSETQNFKIRFTQLVEEGYWVISFFASAESRSLLSLGFDIDFIINKVKWLDPFVFWRMITHCDPTYQYGWVYCKDEKSKLYTYTQTIAPENPDMFHGAYIENDEGVEEFLYAPQHRRIGNSLVDVYGRLFARDIDREQKDKYRDLILYGHTNGQYTDEDRNNILFYCVDDCSHLYEITEQIIQNILIKEYKLDITGNQMRELSVWMVVMGIVESNGIPINKQKFDTFCKNYRVLDNNLVDIVNKEYKFYRKDKCTAKERRGGKGDTKWVFDKTLYADFINSLGFGNTFPKTKKGSYKTDKDTLEIYDTIEAIRLLKTCRESRKHINFFRPDNLNSNGDHNIEANIGSDNCIRILQGAYGSVTGRNQPSVKAGWIMGMSSWVRPIIEAPKGYSIVGCDFASQEIFLQAVLSGDNQMLKAYWSADPYTWFAQTCGLLPKSLVRKEGKFLDKIGEEYIEVDKDQQTHYRSVRNLFKAVTLGIGYGLGVVKLAMKMTASAFSSLSDDDKDVVKKSINNNKFKNQAQNILNRITFLSKKRSEPYVELPEKYSNYYRNKYSEIFHVYEAWRGRLPSNYLFTGKYTLADGWSLVRGLKINLGYSQEADKTRTIQNFPIQGTGAAILRLAVKNMLLNELQVIFTVHDAVYVLVREGAEEAALSKMKEIMMDATGTLTGKKSIRVDGGIYTTNWNDFTSEWTKDKGYTEFSKFGKYFCSDFSTHPIFEGVQ